MNDLNIVALVGRLTRDAEAPAGNGPVRLSIAVNRSVKRGEEWAEEASFFELEYWHKSILPYLVKGKQIAVQGELKQDRWTDASTGQPRSKIVIHIPARDGIKLLGGGGQGETGQGDHSAGSGVSTGGRGPSGVAQPPAASPSGGFNDDFTDDIPF